MLNRDIYNEGIVFSLRLLNFLKNRFSKNKIYLSRFGKLKKQFYSELWNSTADQFGAEVIEYPYGYIKIKLKDKWTMLKESNVMIDNYLTYLMAGNKAITSNLLSEINCPVPKQHIYDLSTLKSAYEVMKAWNKPVVVKPALGGASGVGITTGINSYETLKKASLHASLRSTELLFEEQIEGDSYRLVYLNGEFIDAILKESPSITGDGKSTIKKLIENENIRRMNSSKIVSLNPLTIDLELNLYLKQQNYHLGSILPKDKTIQVKRVVNQTAAEQCHSVVKQVNRELVELGSKISKHLKIEFSGVDLITKNISEPLEKVGGVINEVNTTPGIQHHYLISKKESVVPVAYHVLKYLLNQN